MAAAGLVLRFLKAPEDQLFVVAKRVAAAGNVMLLFVFVYRWWHFGAAPFTSMGDSLNLFLVLCTGIMLTIQRRTEMQPLLVYYFPALAIMAIISGLVGPRYLDVAPRALNGVLLTIHVGLVFLSFALFFVASLTSAAYAVKAQRLKSLATGGFVSRLPALDSLDRTLYRLIAAGYVAFVVTAVLGFAWAFSARELLGDYWFISPKIILSFAMVLLYAVCFHGRGFGLLRGPNLAYLVVFGFTTIMAVYLVVGMFQVGGAEFWGRKA
jgi:ABC-type transport system involved in cytochrome c biogenesis permease subunit